MPFKRVTKGFTDHQAAVIAVNSLDRGPGRMLRACAGDDLIADLDEAVVHVPVLPVGIGHAPVQVRVLFELPQPLLQRFAVNVKPELLYQGAVGGEHVLEQSDALDPVVECLVIQFTVHALQEQGRVTAAQVEPNLSPGRQAHPIAPHAGPHRFALALGVEPMSGDPAGIHPGIEQVYHLGLASATHAREVHQDRRFSLLAKSLLQREQAGPQYALPVLEFRVGDGRAFLCLAKQQGLPAGA